MYNIHTIQRCSACQFIGINKKPIPMGDDLIELINKQASEELCGVESANINMETTVNDYEERGDESNSDFEYEDKSYETSDDSTVAGDGDLSNEPDQVGEDQGQHFNVPEVNDIDEDESDNGDEGVGKKGVFRTSQSWRTKKRCMQLMMSPTQIMKTMDRHTHQYV